MSGFPNPFSEPRPESPGEAEVKKASLFLLAFRWLHVSMSEPGDEAAVERVGVLLWRWLRNSIRRKQ